VTAFYGAADPEPTSAADSAACTACGLPWAAHAARAVITMPAMREGQEPLSYERGVDLGDCVALLKKEMARLRERVPDG
jgi:hypothetical protein